MADATLERKDDYWRGTFEAMAGPCEVLVDDDARDAARRALDVVRAEAHRIERKFSRYRSDSVIHAINTGAGRPVAVDDETADLLDFAERCYALSDGLFDVTSGVLRRAWRFDGSDRVPVREVVDALLPLVGWAKVRWRRPVLALPAGMEIDLGGIGKEYAVDRAAALVDRAVDAPVLVNFGGDLFANAPRRDGRRWRVGVEEPLGARLGRAPRVLEVGRGALATSGDAQRYLLKDGVRYSHVLDPRTGWPVAGAPRSVTVLSGTCTDAGLLATLSLLHGADAETFLEAQGVTFWCSR